MRIADRYPPGSVTGACFIYRCMLEPGERVIDTDIDVEILPPEGRLVISERAVRDMLQLLGLKLLTPELEIEVEATREALSDACVQLDELVDAMAGMVNLPAVERALDIAARKVAGKESIQEWVETLPKVVRR